EANAEVHFNSGTTTFTSSILDNFGTCSWEGGDLTLNNSTINNTGTFYAESGAGQLTSAGAVDTVNNLGNFVKESNNVTETIIRTAFNNLNIQGQFVGVVTVNSGSLTLTGNGQQSSEFHVDAAGTLTFGSNGRHDLNQGTTFTGTGWVVVTDTATWRIAA